MSPRREGLAFAATLAALVAGFFHESLFAGKVLSPADVLLVSASFRDERGANYEPANRLLMDPVLQFQPWIEFNRAMIRQGRLPLWNASAGCGAPHLANGQSAVFDPFQVIAYLGKLPDAYAWMAAARLWMAGIGMFLLARSWGFGPWGRWFSGMSFPFCGFLVVWLLYPVTNVAVWMPWLFWAGDRVLRRPEPRGVGILGLVTGLVLLGGHVQTSAHVLLAAGLYALWRTFLAASRVVTEGTDLEVAEAPSCGLTRKARVGLACWSVGVSLGILLAAVEVVPLGAYLTRSPVWEDREAERASPWNFTRPRVVGAVCTAFPYAFGSQRRGHPHLGRALGVDNLNETAGGFAGLATLVWLTPLAWSTRRTNPRVWFLAGLGLIGALGSYGLPPVDNLLRALPVLGVTDNRRLSLWVAFALILLGGLGLDRLHQARVTRAVWLWVAAALVLLAAGGMVSRLEPTLSQRARDHYAKAVATTPGADPAVYRARAERQVQATLSFLPRYYGLAALHLLALAGLAASLPRQDRGRWGVPTALIQPAIVALTLVDLLGFGFGLNPAIARADDRPESPVIAYLRREVKPPGRIVALGEELPPNVLMRYGLADIRNYDSVEMTRNLRYFAPLYEPGPQARTSRREVTWDGVVRARDQLADAGVQAVVASTPPPAGTFPRVDRVGDIWIARIDGSAWIAAKSARVQLESERLPGKIAVSYQSDKDDRVTVRETFDSGWRATVDGRPVDVGAYRDTFLEVAIPAGRHRLDLWYVPPELPLAIAGSVFALISLLFALTLPRWFRSTRIIADGLGRTQAVELESDLCSSPAKH